MYCIVKNCPSRDKRMYSEITREKWLTAIGKPNIRGNLKICGNHFNVGFKIVFFFRSKIVY